MRGALARPSRATRAAAASSRPAAARVAPAQPSTRAQPRHARPGAVVLARSRGRATRAAADGSADAPAEAEVEMPRTPERQISLAVRSVCAAFKEGKTRQRTEILLPLIGATDLDDWPGGIQQQFKAALPLVEDLLRGVREGTGLTGKLEAEVIDMGDAVGCFESDKILAVLFPSGSTMKEIIKRAEGKELVLLINPQWSTENAYSNVISDFGILWAKERAEKFLQPFVETFYFVQTRVDGENLRVLRAWPLGYQVFAVDEVGGGRFLGSEPGRPAYATLKELAASFEGSKAAMGIIDRMYAEADYMRKTMKAPPPRE